MDLFLPELVLTAAGIGLLLLEAFTWTGRRGTIVLSFAALAAAAWFAYTAPNGVSFGMFTMDPSARYLKILLLAGVGMVLALADGFDGFQGADFSWPLFGGLTLLSSVGLLMMVSSSDLLMVLISIELVSI